ncbi:hypothetical protein [Microbacterium sp. No. 7]|uniref:hypothetical protein n=1 Tax=Microbacterium sp. No. 7 TaxID=1714373 RepID=UPI0006D29A2F|nr:hypothetical protein [Microbacterium sp. No. 7]
MDLDALAYAAQRRGWSYLPHDPSLRAHFREARGADPRRVVRGRHEGKWFVAFETEQDNSYVDGNTMMTVHSTTVRQVVALDLGVELPSLEVTPQGAISRLFGQRAVIPTGHAGFDHANAVRTPWPEFAGDVLPGILPVLLQWPPIAWRFDGRSLVTVAGDALRIDHIDAMLAFATAVADAVPSAVWQRLGRGDGDEGGPTRHGAGG